MLVRKFFNKKQIKNETEFLLILLVSMSALFFLGCKDNDAEPKDVPDTNTTFTIPTYATTIHRYHRGQTETSGTWPTFTIHLLPTTMDITICTVPMPRMVMKPKGMDIFKANVQPIW